MTVKKMLKLGEFVVADHGARCPAPVASDDLETEPLTANRPDQRQD